MTWSQTAGSAESQGPSVRTVAARYIETLERMLRRTDFDAVERVATLLREARNAEQNIFVAGNGGSSATASHWVNDLGKATKDARRPHIRAFSLSDNVSWLTALANDEGYEHAFSGQLENFAREGDVLVCISASGNSPNLLRAVDVARENGVVTVALLGFDGGRLKDRVDEYLWLPTAIGAYGLVECAHSVLCDILTTCLSNCTAPFSVSFNGR